LIKGYSSLFEKLEIQYGGQKIENLTVSKIVFWNNGNETIDRGDLAIHPYIWPRIEGTNILDVKVITTSTVGNRFESIMLPDRRFIALSFDYLDAQQGAVIQVIHTGVSIAPLMIDGEVKGVKRIEYKTKRRDLASQLSRIILYFYAVMMFALVGVFVYNSVFLGIPVRANWSVWVLAVVWIAVLVAIYTDIRQMRDTAKIPKELSAFEKDDLGIKMRG
jgi:hypothetical protein